jgi:hypothetical protein
MTAALCASLETLPNPQQIEDVIGIAIQYSCFEPSPTKEKHITKRSKQREAKIKNKKINSEEQRKLEACPTPTRIAPLQKENSMNPKVFFRQVSDTEMKNFYGQQMHMQLGGTPKLSMKQQDRLPSEMLMIPLPLSPQYG